MKIEASRENNQIALKGVSEWLGLHPDTFTPYYQELILNQGFLKELSRQIEKNSNFKKDPPKLFSQVPISNPDWFGLQRILLYCIVRLLEPNLVLETGVYYGGNSAFILQALEVNQKGKLIGIDLPQHSMIHTQKKNRHPWVGESETYSSSFQPGFIIPDYLGYRFDLRIGDSVEEIKKIGDSVDFFIHDSEHIYAHVEHELKAALKLMKPDGLILVDDIDWSNAFYDFIVRKKLYAMFLPDNGKDDLRMRFGIVKLDHEKNDLKGVTKR